MTIHTQSVRVNLLITNNCFFAYFLFPVPYLIVLYFLYKKPLKPLLLRRKKINK